METTKKNQAPCLITEITGPVVIGVDAVSQTLVVRCVQRISRSGVSLPGELRFDAEAFGALAGGIMGLVKAGAVTLHDGIQSAVH